MISCLHAAFLALWQICCTVPFVGLRARTPYAFIHHFCLFQPPRLPLAKHASLLLLVSLLTSAPASASLCWPRVQNSLPAPSPPALGGSASFKSSHAAADQGLVKFYFPDSDPLSVSILPFLSSCHARVLCSHCPHTCICLHLLFSPFQGEHLSSGPPPPSPVTPACHKLIHPS